jgi:PAS domain S-box-containing protein
MPEPVNEKSTPLDILKNILNAVDAFICVTVPETGEILYLNDHILKSFGIEGDYTGQFCYKILQNLDKRCDICPYYQLEKEPEKIIVWEQYEPSVNKTFRKIGLLIDWPAGGKAHIEYGFDITDIIQTHKALERRVLMMDTLNKTLEVFCNHNEKTFDEVLETGLRPIADLMEVERITVYRYMETDGEKILKQMYRWEKEIKLKQKNFGLLRDHNVFSGWVNTLRGNNCVNQRVCDMTEAEAAFVNTYGIKSILMVPVFLRGELWGSVNFQDHTKTRLFDRESIDLMRAVANTCGSGIIRAEAEQQAAAAHEFNRIIFSTAPVGFTMFDENMNIFDCNEYISSMCGVTREYYVEHFYDLSPEYQPSGVKSDVKAHEIMENTFKGETVLMEWNHSTYEGEVIPCEVTSARIKKGDKFIGIAYVYDLRNIKKLERSVIEAEERIKLILNSTPMCCDLWDRTMALIDCNDAAIKLYQAKSKQDYIDNFWRFSPERQPDGQRSHEKALFYLNKAFDEGDCVFEWMSRLADGTLMPSKVILTRLKYKDGHIVAAYTIDMREHQRMVDEIENALFKAQEANRAKNEFMSRMSHEMLTPMNVIIGMTQLIKMQYETAELNEYADCIGNASHDLLRMINDVLDMSNLEFGALQLEPAAFSFVSMFDKVHKSLERNIKKKQQTFAVDIDRSIPPRLMGDEKRLTQVIYNLLKNAVKFTPAHGSVRFKARVLDKDKENVVLRIEITDNGIGMSKEQQNKLFDLFEQADGTLTRKYEGIGLGLAFSKRIIELMGGSIWVDSELGHGSRFSFTCKMKPL